MNKTYVTLVSEQAVPNVQYIKEFAKEITTFLFVSTGKMEEKNKTKNIIEACQLQENTYHVIRVDEESLTSILSNLKIAIKHPVLENTEGYIVNCTLGTKVMSIALYEFFKNNPHALLLYSPINTNRYRSILNNDINQLFSSTLSVEEYIKSYGIKINSIGTPLFNSSTYTEIFFEKYMNFSGKQFTILSHLQLDSEQLYRKKGIKDFNLIDGLSNFLNEIDFTHKSKLALTSSEVKYLTGGWFEEWVFYRIKSKLNKKDGEIVLGLNTLIDASNDLDVVFMHNNAIHIIECKTAIPERSLQESTIYKSGALVEKFGRNAFSYLFTLSDLSDGSGMLRPGVKDRAQQQKILIADRNIINNKLEEFLNKHFI